MEGGGTLDGCDEKVNSRLSIYIARTGSSSHLVRASDDLYITMPNCFAMFASYDSILQWCIGTISAGSVVVQVLCYNCQQEGHFKRDCLLPKKKKNEKDQVGGGAGVAAAKKGTQNATSSSSGPSASLQASWVAGQDLSTWVRDTSARPSGENETIELGDGLRTGALPGRLIPVVTMRGPQVLRREEQGGVSFLLPARCDQTGFWLDEPQGRRTRNFAVPLWDESALLDRSEDAPSEPGNVVLGPVNMAMDLITSKTAFVDFFRNVRSRYPRATPRVFLPPLPFDLKIKLVACCRVINSAARKLYVEGLGLEVGDPTPPMPDVLPITALPTWAPLEIWMLSEYTDMGQPFSLWRRRVRHQAPSERDNDGTDDKMDWCAMTEGIFAFSPEVDDWLTLNSGTNWKGDPIIRTRKISRHIVVEVLCPLRNKSRYREVVQAARELNWQTGSVPAIRRAVHNVDIIISCSKFEHAALLRSLAESDSPLVRGEEVIDVNMMLTDDCPSSFTPKEDQ